MSGYDILDVVNDHINASVNDSADFPNTVLDTPEIITNPGRFISKEAYVMGGFTTGFIGAFAVIIWVVIRFYHNAFVNKLTKCCM